MKRVLRGQWAGRTKAVLDRTFEAVVVDWDSTAVPDRRADIAAIRSRIERLSAAGVHVTVVGGSHLRDVDGRLRARPGGPGRLHLCPSRGSEVFEVTRAGPVPVWQRTATDGKEAALVTGAARAPGLADHRVTGDAGHVEIGLTDESDSARWVAAWLEERGITGRLVLVVGDPSGPVGGRPGRDSLLLPLVPEWERAVVVSVGAESPGPPDTVLHLGGGPARLLELLDEQVARRHDRRVPGIDDDPAWVLALPEERTAERAAEAIGALSNGWAGTRASREEDCPGTAPLFLVNGVYTNDAEPHLLAGPVWTGLDARCGRGERLLDLRTGTLVRTDDRSGLRTLRFVSAARPHALALRAEAPSSTLGAAGPFEHHAAEPLERRERDGVRLARTSSPGGGGIAVAAHDDQHLSTRADRRVVERLAAWAAHPSTSPEWDEAACRLAEIERVGFDGLLAEHREAWARRWADALVVIEGDPDDQLAARFAVFHLLGAAPDEGEAAVGARGLTGPAYGGHVFWDADVYVLPALAALRPGAARAMLEYRVRRLAAARGGRGARFPWESATDGNDVTPRHVRGPRGDLIPVLTGAQEEHIVADVAWAACEYAAWTGDRDFLVGAGGELLTEAARYWAARVRSDGDGRGHLDDLMGPDEYHEGVDDNAYTNVMARWTLRRAAQLAEDTGGDPSEAATWRDLADRLADGWDPDRGLYEQFAGYWDLEPLLASHVAPPPFAADVLLGAERVAQSQLIKQPDVLMLHHLVPDEVEPGSLAANLGFYDPRTAHGSSLSPAIHAALFARAGQPDRALELFRVAARLDHDDLTGTTAGGVHLGTMGGVWQALAYGFLGLRPRGEALDIDPSLPTAWDALGQRLRFLGRPIAVRAEHDAVAVSCERPVTVRVAGGPSLRCDPPGRRFALDRSRRDHEGNER